MPVNISVLSNDITNFERWHCSISGLYSLF